MATSTTKLKKKKQFVWLAGAQARQIAIAHEMPKEYTFQPQILAKSSEMASRTPYDLAIGDAEEHQMAIRRARLNVEGDELKNFNFRPKVSSKFVGKDGKIKEGKGVISGYLEGGRGEYVRNLELLEKEKEAKLQLLRKVSEAEEMKECTFTPAKTNCPVYVKRIARSMSITRKHREINAETQIPSWK